MQYSEYKMMMGLTKIFDLLECSCRVSPRTGMYRMYLRDFRATSTSLPSPFLQRGDDSCGPFLQPSCHAPKGLISALFLVNCQSWVIRIAIILTFGIAAFHLQAAGSDPADLFLKAYQEYQDAGQLENKNAPDKALAKYHYVASILKDLQRNSGEWQPLVVSYRLRKTQESIARLETMHPSSFNPNVAASAGPETHMRIDTPSLSITPPKNSRQSTVLVASNPGSTLFQQVQQLRWQLAQANEENRRLAALFAKTEAEKRSAQVEVDKVKVSLMEAKAQSTEMLNATNLVRRQTERLGRIQNQYDSRISTLEEKINILNSDNEVLSEENNRLLAKLQKAADYIRTSDSIQQSLQKDRLNFYKGEYAAKSKIKQLRDNTQLIEQFKQTNRELSVKNSALLQQITQLQTASTQSEASAKNQDAQTRTLLEGNSRLSAQLTQSKEQIETLQKEYMDSNQQLVHSEAAVKQQTERISNLEKQLENISVAQAPSIDKENLRHQQQENELLRSIILREMNKQTQRNQAVEFIGDELKRLRIDSPVLLNRVSTLRELLGPQLTLTEKEKKLFPSSVATSTPAASPPPPSLSDSFVVRKQDGPPATEKLVTKQDLGSTLTSEEKALAQSAETAFKQRKFLEAETLYERIIEKNPNNAWVLANLGAVQSQLKKYDAAEGTLHKALSIDPSDTFAITTLGVLQLKRSQINNAIETLKNSVKLDSRNFAAHNYLGAAYGEIGRLKEAEKELKLAAQLNPYSADVCFNLALLYLTQNPSNKELGCKFYYRAIHLGASPDPALEHLIQ